MIDGRLLDLVKLIHILEIYATASGTFKPKKAEATQNEDAQESGATEGEEGKQEFLKDQYVIQAVSKIANFVYINDLSNHHINSFIGFRTVFKRQKDFWNDQNKHDMLNILTGVPEALLRERIGQLEKFAEFIMGLATYISVCENFATYLVLQEREVLYTIEYIFMSVQNSMNHIKKHLTKPEVANSFRTSSLKLCNMTLQFYYELFSQ